MKEDIDELIKQSMKAKTRTRTEVLRAIKTAFLVHETQKNAKPLDKATEIAIIKKLRDQRIIMLNNTVWQADRICMI